MGKATVVSGGADGSYQIKLDYGKAERDKRVAQLGLDRAFLIIEITRITGLLEAQQALEDAARIVTEAAIAAYVAAGSALEPALQAVKDREQDLADANEATYPNPEDKAPAIAAAQGALTAANAAYTAANAAIKTTLEAHAKALTALVAEKQKTEGLRLELAVPETEHAAMTKEITRLQGLTLEETKQAWCADLTEDATGEVATIEIPGEDKLILIYPEAPVPIATDGVLAAREMQSPEQLFWNAAVLPGWQKFKPTYRRGTITAINEVADTADVLLETTDKSSAQNLVINQTPTLSGVPVKYMDCNTLAFEVGNRCVIRFMNQSWDQPIIVGFVDNPKACNMLLSGVVRGMQLVDIADPETGGLRRYFSALKPTANAWEKVMKSTPQASPTRFDDNKFLGRSDVEQYRGLCASMFSGAMAKCVQVLLGRGFDIGYLYGWAHCHGIVFDTAGKPWLVSISSDNGVLAKKLPVAKGNVDSEVVAEAEIVALLGGVPTGGAAALGLAGFEGEGVIRLATAEHMSPFFTKIAPSAATGWSFNDSGGVAQNTAYLVEQPANAVTGYLYQLEISISTSPQGVGSGSAVLTLLEEGGIKTTGEPVRFVLPDGTRPPASDTAGAGPLGVTGPLYVCFINDAFDVARSVFVETAYEERNDPPGASPVSQSTFYRGLGGGHRVEAGVGKTSESPYTVSIKKTPIGSGVVRQERVEQSTGFLFALPGCRDGYGFSPVLSGVAYGVDHTAWAEADEGGGYQTGGDVSTGIPNFDPNNYSPMDYGFGANLGAITRTQYYAARDVFKSPILLGYTNMEATVFSRYAAPVVLEDANRAGQFLVENGTFRFSTLGSESYAFVINDYENAYLTHENFELIYRLRCGVTYLGGGVDADDPVLGRQYNFIGRT